MIKKKIIQSSNKYLSNWMISPRNPSQKSRKIIETTWQRVLCPPEIIQILSLRYIAGWSWSLRVETGVDQGGYSSYPLFRIAMDFFQKSLCTHLTYRFLIWIPLLHMFREFMDFFLVQCTMSFHESLRYEHTLRKITGCSTITP